MAIARKPKKNQQDKSVDVDALINKGGSVAQLEAKTVQSSGEKQVALRIPAAMLEELDELLQRRTIRIPRHTWILEAVAEKLEREDTETA